MSSRGAAMVEAIVPFAPKSNARAETGDPLERAGQTILSALTEPPVLLRKNTGRP